MNFFCKDFLISICLSVFCLVVEYKDCHGQVPIGDYGKPGYPSDWNKPTVMPDRIMLNCTEDPSATASISWRTHEEITHAYVEIALASGSPKFWESGLRFPATSYLMDATHIPVAGIKARYHQAEIGELLPDTLYAYRVGSGKYWSEWFQFRTASDKPKPFSFLYLGDAQSYIRDLWSRAIRSAVIKVPQARFIIHAGDLVGSAHDDDHWHEWFTAGGWLHATIPGVPIPGNHEYQVLDKLDTTENTRYLSYQWKYQFNLPKNGPEQMKGSSYYFNYQKEALVVALNSNEFLEEQVPWLDSILANTPCRWKILTFHHPVFSGARERDNAQLRSLWKHVIDKHQVDVVLTGHDHIYTRGKATGSGKSFNQSGTVCVVSVAGGKMYDASEKLWESYDAKLLVSLEHTQLFQAIHIDGPSLRYEAFTADGKLIDSFELKKSR